MLQQQIFPLNFQVREQLVAPVYKVSLVVKGRRDIGEIQSISREPEIGDVVTLGQETYRIVELVELMPPRKEFIYLHAVCQPA